MKPGWTECKNLISFSIFSLSWASWRVFFILRTRDESDPDPNFKTTFLQILPWELMIVINSTILWTLIGGLLGKYFFIRVLLGFFVLYVTEYTRKRNSSDTKAHEEDENVNIVNTGRFWDFWEIFRFLEDFQIFGRFSDFWKIFRFLDNPRTFDIWDTVYNSDNWEPEFMTIFVIWQLIVTLDSIRNSCDVLETLHWWDDAN